MQLQKVLDSTLISWQHQFTCACHFTNAPPACSTIICIFKRFLNFLQNRFLNHFQIIDIQFCQKSHFENMSLRWQNNFFLYCERHSKNNFFILAYITALKLKLYQKPVHQLSDIPWIAGQSDMKQGKSLSNKSGHLAWCYIALKLSTSYLHI